MDYNPKRYLIMNLSNLSRIEAATTSSHPELLRIGIALFFMIGVMLYTYTSLPHESDNMMLAIAAMMGGYMALNIGANDVANNVGPAVGSQALTLIGAIIIAVIFETAGAFIAGGDVVSTIKKGIIDPSLINDVNTFVWLMMAALMAGAVWLNIATAMGAPVSTTHSIVGGVLGAGIAAGGWQIADWNVMSAIAASWVISPLLGGIIAAGFLYLIKRTITYKEDMIGAAKHMVPILVGLMTWAFSTYLILKGLKKIWQFDLLTALGIGATLAVIVYFIVKPVFIKTASNLENNKQAVNSLFTIPLIFAAALLSFAHGANDVANAIGPLAAINDAIIGGNINSNSGIPFWVMAVGAIGIALGLALYGPKLIRTVGSEITELDKMRAFCVAMAAAITVIIASQMGLPVSSTHIAVGGIFGVGFLREYLKRFYAKIMEEIMTHHEGADQKTVEYFLTRFKKASVETKRVMLKELKKRTSEAQLSKKERKSLRRVYHEALVKRSALLRIAAAWVITVPFSAFLAAMFYFMIRGMMLP